jgi:hypothetical protein
MLLIILTVRVRLLPKLFSFFFPLFFSDSQVLLLSFCSSRSRLLKRLHILICSIFKVPTFLFSFLHSLPLLLASSQVCFPSSSVLLQLINSVASIYSILSLQPTLRLVSLIFLFQPPAFFFNLL